MTHRSLQILDNFTALFQDTGRLDEGGHILGWPPSEIMSGDQRETETDIPELQPHEPGVQRSVR